MAAAMTFCSTAILPGKSKLQILRLWHHIFTCALAGIFYEQMEALIQSRS